MGSASCLCDCQRARGLRRSCLNARSIQQEVGGERSACLGHWNGPPNWVVLGCLAVLCGLPAVTVPPVATEPDPERLERGGGQRPEGRGWVAIQAKPRRTICALASSTTVEAVAIKSVIQSNYLLPPHGGGNSRPFRRPFPVHLTPLASELCALLGLSARLFAVPPSRYPF